MDDFDLEQQAILARRQRAAALRGAGMPEGRMVGNVYVRPSFTQYLASGLKQVAGAKDEQAAEADMRALGEKRRSMERGELEAIAGALRGTPAKPAFDVPANEMGEGFTMNPVQAQPGSAEAMYARALQSPMADFRKMGMQGIGQQAQFAAQQKAAQDEADRKAAAIEAERRRVTGILQQTQGNPQAALAAGVPVEMVKAFYDPGLGKSKLQFVNGVPVDPYAGTAQGPAIPQQAPPVNPRSDLLIPDPKDPSRLIPNVPLIGAKSQVASAGAGRTTNTVINAGPKAFETELGQLDAKQLGKYRDNAETAQSLLGTVANLREAEKAGAYSGGGADIRLGVASLIEGWTGIAPPGLVGSQIYNAEASKLILDRVKALGANPSNADREFIQKTVPQLATSAEARKQMADWMEKTASKSIDLYQRADQYARQNRGLGGFNVITPSAPKAPGLPDISAIEAEIARRKAKK